MQPNDQSKKRRRQLTSQDLKRRLYEKGTHGNSMPSLKNPIANEKANILYVNLNSSVKQKFNDMNSKKEGSNSPKILRKTASGFRSKSREQKAFFPNITSNEFTSKKKSPFTNSPKVQTPLSPSSKTAMNFYHPCRIDSQPQEQIQFNSSFYKNDSTLRNNQTRLTKRLVEKMSGHRSRYDKSEKSKFAEDQLKQSPPSQQEQKDEIIETQLIKQAVQTPLRQTPQSQGSKTSQSSLQEYISLILKNVPHVDQFLYLIRHKSLQSLPQQQNIYQLDIIDYQQIKQKDKDPTFQYYTISKKGFCHYIGSKPIEFIDLKEWLEEKQIYEKIKKLKFFSRFRRWKTIKMWIKKVVRHRIEKCSLALQEKLFILNPTVRTCILQINKINLQMEKGLCIISKNQGTYTLESFKHCQQKTRRQAASIVEEFSRRSRQSVRKCFDDCLENLKQVLKTKGSTEEKGFVSSTHNPKDNSFQVLGFPAKMSYEHRSKLRKLTGKFVRLSYLVDFIHLNGLAGIFKSQIQSFSSKLNKLQIQSQVQVICSKQKNKGVYDDNDEERMFLIQLIFKPYEISQAYINEVPMQSFDISINIEKASQFFNPLYHIREKVPQIKQEPVINHAPLHLIKQQSVRQTEYRKYIPSICELWLSMKPTLDNIFDELSFLIKQSMASLKFFERWSKHREMQKYINILQEWDDIVSDNWQISQNDNLDPISIIENLQFSMSRIKQMLQVSQNKLTQKIVQHTTDPLNIYWENTQADVNQLLTNPNIQNNAQTIQFYLAYMTQWIQKFQLKIPNIVHLGIFTVALDKMKYQIIDFMRQAFQAFKEKLPNYVQEHTNNLNIWLNDNSQRLRQQIHNIDDFVRLNKSLKQIDEEFHHKKQLCNDLGQIYQTMYNYKIESKKRKDFEIQTLKAKDQLEQLLIHVQQNIQRKTQFFTRQVSRYHLPNLLKDIEKISDNISSEQFESLKSSPNIVIQKLTQIRSQYENLKEKKQKCLEYLSVLKLSQVTVTQLDELQRQINTRLEMWQNLQSFNEFIKKIDNETVSEMDLDTIREFVTKKRQAIKAIESTHNKPQNEVLQLIKFRIQKYYINIPLLQGFNDRLSDSHWDEISQIVKEYPYVDLKRKQFTMKQFLETGIGKEAKKIQFIFNKAKVEYQLQLMYTEVENAWTNTLVRSKQESKFIVLSNPEVMREVFDYMFRTLCTILSNPFSQTLRQYSLTYDSLTQYYNTFQHWLTTQQHLLKIDSMCKLIDVKKLPDYSQFQNCQKTYKNIMKLFSNRMVDTGVKMNKLFVVGLDDRLNQIDEGLKRVQDNIKVILEQHRKAYPPYYLFTDEQLFKIITSPSNPQTIQSTSLSLIPSLSRLQFQNERICGIYNTDNEKLQRNMISTTIDIQQIIQQLRDTVTDANRKSLRSCKYKAVEIALVKLVPAFQTQYLLAVNKVDFTNYTEISIDNQVQSPQSLKQFHKVMKKDIIEDLRLRTTIKQDMIMRYDTLILQSLYHQQLLSKLIKQNVQQTTDYEWQRQIRFYWDEGNNDDNNITVKQNHNKLKYGNQYIGSKSKVVIQSDSALLYSLSQAETAITTSSAYQLQRVFNFIGQRMALFECDKFTTKDRVINFAIGHWYTQTVMMFKNVDSLQREVMDELMSRKMFRQLKQAYLRKNSFNMKQSEKRQTAVFLAPTHPYQIHNFRSTCRTITHIPITLGHLKNLLRVKDIFEVQNDISLFLLKMFQILNYFEEKAAVYNLVLEDFLQNRLKFTPNLHKKNIFEEFLAYVQPKIGSDTMKILQETIRLESTTQITQKYGKDEILELGCSKMLTQNKSLLKQKERQKIVSKRSSSRQSQSKLLPYPSSAKLPQKHAKPRTKLSKLLVPQDLPQQQQRHKSVRQALEKRHILILTGEGNSKLHLVKQIYSSTHKVIEIFSSLTSQHLSEKGIITHYITRLDQSQSNVVLYFDGINSDILKELGEIWHNSQYKQVKQKLQKNRLYIIIATQKLPHVDYNVTSWLHILNIELPSQYLVQVGKEFSQRLFSESSQHQAIFTKFFSQTLLSTFDNWSIKDTKTRQRYVYIFLTYLESLLPVKKLLDAMVYCFIRLFGNMDADYIKLEFLVKKLIGQDKVSQDQKVYELVYSHYGQEGLIHSKDHFKAQCHPPQNLLYSENIITHTNYHHTTIMHRILTKTTAGIYLIGPTNSGKSTLYEIYKHLHYENKSFLKLTMLNDKVDKKRMIEQIMGNVNVHGLNEIKGRVNYERALIMVDDVAINYGVGLSKSALTKQESLIVKNNEQKLTFIKQLLQYKLIQYPSFYAPPAFQKTQFSLSQINFILSSHHQHESFKSSTIPLELNLHQNELKSIFAQYLRQRLNYFEVNDLTVFDIVSTTFDICKKLGVKNNEFDGLQVVTTKNILNRFFMLKVKESGNVIKQIQKYWVYLLQQHLGLIDRRRNKTIIKPIHADDRKKTTKTAQQKLTKQQQFTQHFDSIISKELRNLNLQQIKPSSLCYSFLHTRSQSFSSNEYSKRVEFVKDIKKIFNLINEKIQKYNESENKRYGAGFDYIHFDQLVRKIVKLSNNLVGMDCLLSGRKGSGKETLVKLVGYLQGANYKPITESTLKQTVMDIFLNSNITTMSSYLLTKHLTTQEQISQLCEYYYLDFENEILNNKQLDRPQKVFIKDKQKEKEKQRENLRLLNTSTNSKAAQKTLTGFNLGSPQYYIPPRQRLTQEDVIRYREAIRVVILVDEKSIVDKIPLKIKQQLMLDELEEIPLASVQQYTTKFLQAEQIKPKSNKVPLLLAQVWNYAKDQLQLGLRCYDDAIRLYCSFIDTLTEEIHQEYSKYSRVIQLYAMLNKLNESLSAQIQHLHSTIKTLTEQIIAQQSEEKKHQKQLVQEQMHRKSAYVNKLQKVIEMLDLLVPYFKSKHSMIHKYILDRECFEETLIIAACYFTFLSDMDFKERRKVLKSWYPKQGHPGVQGLANTSQVTSFLTLFNLYQQQFNTQPIDDLEDFYENMAIVFNSVKPVFIRDSSTRGKHWLENVCSFICVSQRQANFIEVICENLSKPSNILIEITSQQTMNNLRNTFINALLFLSDSTETVNIKGQQYKVSPQAKFYVLLNDNVQITPQQQQQFTIVRFGQSQRLLENQLQYALMSNCHSDVFYSQLDMKKKIRNLKLQKQALMLEIAENIYSQFESSIQEDKDEQADKQPTGKVTVTNNNEKNAQTHTVKQRSKQQLQQFISQLPDKTLTRGQNLANKLKQKLQLCLQQQSKHNQSIKHTNEVQSFLTITKQVFSTLQFMSAQSLKAHDDFSYPLVSHRQFVKKVTMGLQRKFINVKDFRTVYLFAIKIWGDVYVDTDYYVFLMTLLGNSPSNNLEIIKKEEPKVDIHTIEQFPTNLQPQYTEILKSSQSFSQLQQKMSQRMRQFLTTFPYELLIPYFQHSGTINNLQEEEMRKVTLNNVWVKQNQLSTRFDQKVEQNMKIVRLQIKSLHNLQQEIKKYIFEQNILMITSLELLQTTLQHLHKLGSHEKIIYFKCPINKYTINRVLKMAKKYAITEVNHFYENKNPLLNETLHKIQRQKESKKLSSVSNIKSVKSIAMIRFEDDDEGSYLQNDRKEQNYYNYEPELKNNQTQQQQTSKQPSQLNKPQQQGQNPCIIEKQKQQQSLSNDLSTIIDQIYSVVFSIKSSHNLKSQFYNPSEKESFIEFLSTLNISEDQQFTFIGKLRLLLCAMSTFTKENDPLIDEQIEERFNQLIKMLQEVEKEQESQKGQAELFINKIAEIIDDIKINSDHVLEKVTLKAQRLQFENLYVAYFKCFFPSLTLRQQAPADIKSLVTKARNIFQSIKNIDQPIAVKRNSKRAVNAIFRKEELQQKLLSSAVTLTPISNLSKKPAIRKVSRQSFLQSGLQQKATQTAHKQPCPTMAPIILEMQYKKLSSKIDFLESHVEKAINKAPDLQSVQLLLMLLQDAIPGSWLFILDVRNLFTTSLQSLFKKFVKLQQDMSYCLQKVKRNNHAEIDFSFLNFPKDYLQLHFRKKITHPNDSNLYVLMNNPSNQQLQISEDYVKIASIQAAGWKFANEPNTIDLINLTQKPSSPESKLAVSCCFVKKDPSCINLANLTPIDVYEFRESIKPFMRVYATCKKMPNINSQSPNNLFLYLKDNTNF